MSNPFDYVQAASFSKEDMFTYAQADKEYVPYLTNKAFSYHADSVMYANEMNLHHHLDKKVQFEFYRHSLPKKKRYAKWAKKDIPSEAVELVAKHYGYSMQRAVEAANMMTGEQLKSIVDTYGVGGREPK